MIRLIIMIIDNHDEFILIIIGGHDDGVGGFNDNN